MRTRIIIIALLSVVTINSFAQDTIFEKINNKTWFEDNGFAGTTIVFYKTSTGLLKAIRQINGSGVPVVSSAIYDVENRNDTVFLFNGLNLKTAEKDGTYYYNFDSKTGRLYKDAKQLMLISDKPILFTWTKNSKSVMTQIDVTLLSKIIIGKNEIYKESDLVPIQIDE